MVSVVLLHMLMASNGNAPACNVYAWTPPNRRGASSGLCACDQKS